MANQVFRTQERRKRYFNHNASDGHFKTSPLDLPRYDVLRAVLYL
jgi:hypothetical protein